MSLPELVISPQKASEYLTYSGMRIGRELVCNGIDNGVFDFGIRIDVRDGPKYKSYYKIFKKDLFDFIEEHGGTLRPEWQGEIPHRYSLNEAIRAGEVCNAQ